MNDLFHRLMNSDEVLAAVVAVILSLVGNLIWRAFLGRGKVGWGVSHQYVFNLKPPTGGSLLAFTKQIWIQNIGRSIAKEIEVVFNFKPAHFEIWPQRAYSETVTPANNFIIKFPDLNHREHVTITMFQTATDLPSVTNVRWAGDVGRQVTMGPQQLMSPWTIRVIQILLWLGLAFPFYIAIRIIF